MPTIPCPIHVTCPPNNGNLEFDSPLANFSSEAPDQDLFIGINTGWNLNLPPIGSIWSEAGCQAICTSAISQADADACAARQQLQCLLGGGIGGDRGPFTTPWLLPNGQPVPSFLNAQQQCSWTCADGLLFIWTVAPGYVQALSQGEADAIALSIACRQAALHHICLPALPGCCKGDNYLQTITVDSGPAVTPPLTFAVIGGSLPPGLSLFGVGPVAAQIIGNPTSAGNFNFTLRVTDANGNFMQKQYVLSVLGINGSPPVATENTPYSFQLDGEGGTAPYTFNLVSGNLPGITLSSSGVLSGTPNYITAGKYPFTASITDSTGKTCSQNFTLQVKLRPGPDWTQLNWTTYQINQNPPHTSVTGSAASNVAFGALQTDGTLPNPSISPVAASGVTYTGPQVTARIQITVSANNAFNAMCSELRRNGVAIGGPGCGPVNSGIITANITIPAGVNDVYTIDDASPGNTFAGLSAAAGGSLSFTWAIFNV